MRAQVSRESTSFNQENSSNFIDDNNDDEMPDYGLEDIDASEMFEMFANVTENDGTISKEKFHQVMDSRSNSDPDNLFHLFGTWCSSARVGLWRSPEAVCSRILTECYEILHSRFALEHRYGGVRCRYRACAVHE